jgi:hypothetical protein
VAWVMCRKDGEAQVRPLEADSPGSGSEGYCQRRVHCLFVCVSWHQDWRARPGGLTEPLYRIWLNASGKE